MAASKEAVSFDDIIQADRKRRQNAELAEEIFGRGRKSTPTGPASRKPGTGPSLASRVGIAKASQRSNSNTPKIRDIGEALRGFDPNKDTRQSRVTRPAKENPMARAIKQDLLYEAATGRAPRNANGAGAEISIRGTAGPYVVIGSNFAPGTTAADIESAMLPVGGEMQSCRILTAAPTVMAEMVFTDKANAELVIDTFNNKKADGRVLHIYLHRGPPSALPPPQTGKPPTKPRGPPVDPARSDAPSSYDSQREQSDRNRRRAEPEVQDRSYGFENNNDQMDVEMDAPVPLGVTPPRSDPPRLGRQDDRAYDRRDYAPRDYGRSNYDDRERDRFRGGGRLRDDRRLYSDDLYQRPSGRGLR